VGVADDLSFPVRFLDARHRFRSWNPERIASFQMDSARRIVRWVIQRSPFFAELYRGCDPADVWHLPVSNKKTLMEHLGEYNTLGFTREELIGFCLDAERERTFNRRFRGVNVGMSSGTSGSRGVEMATRGEESHVKAVVLSRFPWPRGEKLNWAFILRVSSPAFRLNFLGNRLTWVSQLDTAEGILEKLNRLQPNMISAPPSMLRILARECRTGHLTARPKCVLAYGEVLYPEVERCVGETFGCPVRQVYKSTEGTIAMSCQENRLHVQEDLMAVQLYDREGYPAPDGEPCHRLVVTNLVYRALPFIRYELNDILSLDPRPCPCGSSFRVIDRIQGRSDDVFWANRVDGTGLQYIFPDYISRAIISSSDGIEEYQAVQSSPAEVLVRILPNGQEPEAQIAEAVAAGIIRVFTAYQCRQPDVRVRFEMPVTRGEANKLIRIRRDFLVEGETNT
jgi:putative adenylate-forming enzyme